MPIVKFERSERSYANDRDDSGEIEDIEPPAPLPEDSILTLTEYLDMQRAIGNETRFRVLRILIHNGDLTAEEVGNVLDLRTDVLSGHLERLVEVGLVQNRKRKEADATELCSYYRATTLGAILLEHGVEELMRREYVFHERYA